MDIKEIVTIASMILGGIGIAAGGKLVAQNLNFI
jgi:hypothetical protein